MCSAFRTFKERCRSTITICSSTLPGAGLVIILFMLIVWENIRVLLVRSWQLKAFQDRAFVFSMLAAMAVLWITLLTVYLGGQLPQISFLLIGWIQSTGQPQIKRVLLPASLHLAPSQRFHSMSGDAGPECNRVFRCRFRDPTL